MAAIKSRGVAEAVKVAEASGEVFAATWRDESGAVVGTTYGGTMCLFPRKPWRIRFSGDGFEGVIRCGECPGCLEFDRRRLADRLHQKYSASAARGVAPKSSSQGGCAHTAESGCDKLFLIRIYAPIDQHARLSRMLHRRRRLELEPGMYRLGATSFGILARVFAPLSRVLARLCLKHRVEPLRLRRGRRAFRSITAGLIVAREVYGRQKNRWYARGLPPAERQKWEVIRVSKYQSYDRARGPRASIDKRLVLVPPDVWRLSRPDRIALRGALARQPDPEGVRKVMGLVADTIRRAGARLLVSAPAKPVLTREAVEAWYKQAAVRSKARTTVTESDPDLPPLSEAGGYVSSVRIQGELMPRELERERRQEWLDAKKRRAVKESMEIIERMKQRAKERGQ